MPVMLEPYSIKAVQHAPLATLDGLAVTVVEKMKELQMGPGAGKAFSHDQPVRADLSGIFAFIDDIKPESKSQLRQLRMLYGVLRARYELAGYKTGLFDLNT